MSIGIHKFGDPANTSARHKHGHLVGAAGAVAGTLVAGTLASEVAYLGIWNTATMWLYLTWGMVSLGLIAGFGVLAIFIILSGML